MQPIEDLTGEEPEQEPGDYRIRAVRPRLERTQSYDNDGEDNSSEEYGQDNDEDADVRYLDLLEGATQRERAIAKANARMGYERH